MRWLSAGPYGNRAGDVLLLSQSGLDHPIEKRYYFSAPYHSWHGSASIQDSHIPLIVARKGPGAKLKRLVDEIGATNLRSSRWCQSFARCWFPSRPGSAVPPAAPAAPPAQPGSDQSATPAAKSQ